jgi:hypothetical protein
LSFTYIYTTEVKYPGNLNWMSFKLLVRFLSSKTRWFRHMGFLLAKWSKLQSNSAEYEAFELLSISSASWYYRGGEKWDMQKHCSRKLARTGHFQLVPNQLLACCLMAFFLLDMRSRKAQLAINKCRFKKS